MRVEGDYWKDGYALARGLVLPETAKHFLAGVRQRFEAAATPLDQLTTSTAVLKRPVLQMHSTHYPPLEGFQYGLTPAVSEIVGKELLPTYCFFRAYQKGDICHVHSDRESCEISLSLTLAYSDDEPWALEVARENCTQKNTVFSDFPEPYSSAVMQAGDGVLYQGVVRNHGRKTPNPNRWSAHVFMHWVDRNGPYRGLAFENRGVAKDVDFALPTPFVGRV